jgi:hypothetical protein
MKPKFVTLKQHEIDQDYLIKAINETRETVASQDRSVLFYSLLISAAMMIAASMIIWYNIPHKICHTEVTNVKYTYGLNGTGCWEFPENTQFLCEDGFNVHRYGMFVNMLICPGNELINDWVFYQTKKTCLIKIKTNVCEIK